MNTFNTYKPNYYYYKERNIDPIGQNGCWIWLDASDNSTFTNVGSKVDQWRDKSISNYTFSIKNTSTDTNKPSYNTTTLNNKPTVSFNRANYQYLVSNNTNFAIGTKSFYLFIVFKFNESGNTTFQGVFNKSFYGGQPGRIVCYKGFQDTNMVLNITQNNPTVSQQPFDMTSTDFNIFALLCDRTTSNYKTTVRQNGTELHSANVDGATAQNLTNPNYIFLGAYNGETEGSNEPLTFDTATPSRNSYFNGSIAEVISYSTGSTMSIENIQKAEGYLAWKWGLHSNLPNGHLYKSSAPT